MIFDSAENRRLIDLFRAVAILQVVLFHVVHGIVRFAPADTAPALVARLPGVLNVAWQAYGVDLLFMVSALLLAVPLIHEVSRHGTIDLRGYFVRRVARILPLYYLAVLFYALAQGSSAQEVFLSALFLGFIVGDYNVIPVGWTMEAIMAFYLALPFAVLWLQRRRYPHLWIAAALALSLLVRGAYVFVQDESFADMVPRAIAARSLPAPMFELYFRVWFRIAPFLIGLSAAYFLARRPDLSAWLARRAGARRLLNVAAGALTVAIVWMPVQAPAPLGLGEPFWRLYWTLAPALFAAAAAWVLVAGLDRGWRLAGPWTMLSRNIFGIYLFHMPMLVLAAVIVFRSTSRAALASAGAWQVLAVFILASILSLGLALFLARTFERPIESWLRRRLHGTQN